MHIVCLLLLVYCLQVIGVYKQWVFVIKILNNKQYIYYIYNIYTVYYLFFKIL